MISPPPGAQAARRNFSCSNREVFAGFVANSSRDDRWYEELRRYYDAELANNGWKFDREEQAIYGRIEDRELAGKIASYSKRNRTARHKYSAPREFEETGERYSFWD